MSDERPLISGLAAETWRGMCPHMRAQDSNGYYCAMCGERLHPRDIGNPSTPLVHISGRTPERVARDLGVWYALGGWVVRYWRVLLVVASYCAAAALGWWLRGMA